MYCCTICINQTKLGKARDARLMFKLMHTACAAHIFICGRLTKYLNYWQCIIYFVKGKKVIVCIVMTLELTKGCLPVLLHKTHTYRYLTHYSFTLFCGHNFKSCKKSGCTDRLIPFRCASFKSNYIC